MRGIVVAALAALWLIAGLSATAGERRVIGVAGFGTNDRLGDGRDRWRTGSYSLTVVIGRNWDGALPARFGEIVEFHLHGEVIAPQNMPNPSPDGRKYAAILGIGVHSQSVALGGQLRAGADLFFVGPQTRGQNCIPFCTRPSAGRSRLARWARLTMASFRPYRPNSPESGDQSQFCGFGHSSRCRPATRHLRALARISPSVEPGWPNS